VNTQGHDKNGEHLVQFYENDAFLIDGITDYIGSALAAGDKGIVIATKRHLDAPEENLNERGLLGWGNLLRRPGTSPLKPTRCCLYLW